MELKSSVKTLNYARKLLLQDTNNILPFPIFPQKPEATGKRPVPLPRTTPRAAGISPLALDTLFRALSASPKGDPHGCMVVQGGSVVCEGWWQPYSGQHWHVTHSLCKSFTGTAIGLLVDENKLELDEKLCDIFPDRYNLLTNRRTRALTVRHLLTMSSGVNFKESGAVLEKDWLKSFLEAEVLFEPGTAFDYNSMNSYVLSAIVKRKTGEGLVEYLTPRLFEPLGFGDVAWEKCPLGIEKGGWGLYVYLEDAIKLGMVYRDKGLWRQPDGATRRILSEEWVQAATTPYFTRESGEEYGFQLWPHSADGTFMFNGMFGQYVLVAPEQNLVIGINAGAGNLFTKSESLRALQAFLKECTAPSTAQDADALAYTLSQLQFDQIPPTLPAPPPAPGLGQRLRALLPQKAPAPTPAPTLPLQCHALHGKSYVFERNRAGMFPVILSCMEDWYTPGLSELRFSVRDNTFWMGWTEGDQTLYVPIGLAAPAFCQLQLGGNNFFASVQGQWTKNEDDLSVLKLTVNLLEHSSTRRIKIFFLPDGSITLGLDEAPGLMLAMRMVENSNTKGNNHLELFRDMDYLWYKIDELCAPTLHGAPPELAPHLLLRSIQPQ